MDLPAVLRPVSRASKYALASSQVAMHLSPLVEEADAVLRQADASGGVWRVGGDEASGPRTER